VKFVKSIMGLALIGLVLLLWAVIVYRPPQIEILNQSGIAVKELEIRIADRSVVRSAMGVGGLDRHSIPVHREGPVTLHLRFKGGQETDFAAGWFSPAQSTLPSIEIVGTDSVRICSF
jgi:hypothetical protein